MLQISVIIGATIYYVTIIIKNLNPHTQIGESKLILQI